MRQTLTLLSVSSSKRFGCADDISIEQFWFIWITPRGRLFFTAAISLQVKSRKNKIKEKKMKEIKEMMGYKKKRRRRIWCGHDGDHEEQQACSVKMKHSAVSMNATAECNRVNKYMDSITGDDMTINSLWAQRISFSILNSFANNVSAILGEQISQQMPFRPAVTHRRTDGYQYKPNGQDFGKPTNNNNKNVGSGQCKSQRLLRESDVSIWIGLDFCFIN